jgi:uncharacterized protein YlaI
LLNEAEAKYSDTLKHFNAKRVYPFWKVCQRCSKPYQCHNKEQAVRSKFCGRECVKADLSEQRKGVRKKPIRTSICQQCNKPFAIKNSNWGQKFCSKICYGDWRAANPEINEHLKQIAPKGRNGWTEAGIKSRKERMMGEKNHAWKGGVTYFKTHGNYIGVKYVRCPPEFKKMARKDGYVMEHRLVVAQAIGRPLLRTEVVHHVNGNPADNRLENLELFATNKDHKLYEHHGSPAPLWRL